MPNRRRRFPVQTPALGAHSARPADQSAILAKTLSTNRFCMSVQSRTPGIRLGGRGFQKINKGLARNSGTREKQKNLLRRTNSLILLCAALYGEPSGGRDLPAGQ